MNYHFKYIKKDKQTRLFKDYNILYHYVMNAGRPFMSIAALWLIDFGMFEP